MSVGILVSPESEGYHEKSRRSEQEKMVLMTPRTERCHVERGGGYLRNVEVLTDTPIFCLGITSGRSTKQNRGITPFSSSVRPTRWTRHHSSSYSAIMRMVSPTLIGNSSASVGTYVAVTVINLGLWGTPSQSVMRLKTKNTMHRTVFYR